MSPVSQIYGMPKPRKKAGLLLPSPSPIVLSLSPRNKQNRDGQAICIQDAIQISAPRYKGFEDTEPKFNITLTIGLNVSYRGKLSKIHSKSHRLAAPEQNLAFKHGCVGSTQLKKITRISHIFGFPFPLKKWKLWGNRKSGQPGFRYPLGNGVDCTLSGIAYPLTS